jgi:single-strand DNA-binding protein
MSGTVNKVILIGNIGKDPELKTFENGGKILNFSLATTESWKDPKTGERVSQTDCQWSHGYFCHLPAISVQVKYIFSFKTQ